MRFWVVCLTTEKGSFAVLILCLVWARCGVEYTCSWLNILGSRSTLVARWVKGPACCASAAVSKSKCSASRSKSLLQRVGEVDLIHLNLGCYYFFCDIVVLGTPCKAFCD